MEQPGFRFLLEHRRHDGDQCLIWPYGCCTSGYGQFNINKTRHMAHRYMCAIVHGDPPEGYEAAHSCGNRRCVNPNHLSWKTQGDNQRDRRVHGTNMKTQRKLTRMQVEQIRQLKGVEKYIVTAARYGVTESNIRLIQNGTIWRDDRKKPEPLTAEEVAAIRRIGASKSLEEVAAMFGRSTSAIWCIRTGRSYRHV